MSVKSKARGLGRMIRRLTGLELPIAMKLGKKIIQGKDTSDLIPIFPDIVSFIPGCSCCGRQSQIKGPKGSIEGFASLDNLIVREYKIKQALAKVPFGTAVSI